MNFSFTKLKYLFPSMSIIGKRRAVNQAAQKRLKACGFDPQAWLISLVKPFALYEFSFSVYEFAFRHMKVRQSPGMPDNQPRSDRIRTIA